MDNFLSAYLQALLFLEILNWYYGIVVDKVLVGKSKFWKIPNVNMSYVQTWKQVLKKRGILMQIWIVGAAIIVGLVVLIF